MKKRIWIYLGVLVIGFLLFFMFKPPKINYPNGCIGQNKMVTPLQKCCIGLKTKFVACPEGELYDLCVETMCSSFISF